MFMVFTSDYLTGAALTALVHALHVDLLRPANRLPSLETTEKTFVKKINQSVYQ